VIAEEIGGWTEDRVSMGCFLLRRHEQTPVHEG